MSLKSETAREYRAKFKDKPTLGLARIMYNKNKELFKDVEDARTVLRYIEGKKGDRNRKTSKKEFFIDEARPYNPYKLPASDETDFKPFVIKGHQRLLVMSDIHVPYHSIDALTATFDYAKKEKPDAILLNGDTIDCHSLSRFARDPRKRSFAQELATFKELFEIIQNTFGCKIYFKLGNHEDRYQHYLWQKAGELDGVTEFEFDNIIKARANGITVIKDKRIIYAGSLNIVHGHEFGQAIFSPVNIARGLYLRGKVSALQGHNHQTSEHTEADMNGKITTTWSSGCLCELNPAYLPINKWNHGFCIVDIDGKDFEVRNKRIYKGKVY